jgi:hypothetical protein
MPVGQPFPRYSHPPAIRHSDVLPAGAAGSTEGVSRGRRSAASIGGRIRGGDAFGGAADAATLMRLTTLRNRATRDAERAPWCSLNDDSAHQAKKGIPLPVRPGPKTGNGACSWGASFTP